MGILFHDPTQSQLWHRLAAFTFMAATRLHLAQVNHHVPFAIPHSKFRDPELGSFCINKVEHIGRSSLKEKGLRPISIGFILHFLDDRLARTACCSVNPG